MNSVRLLLRPRWIEGESWAGFLLRLANENELPGISWLARSLGIQMFGLLTEQPSVVLSHLGYTATDIPYARYPQQRPRASQEEKKGARRSVCLHGRRRETAICPHCLLTDRTPYIRAVWERPIEIGCTIHRAQLLTRCLHCSKKLSVERPRLTECPCGASLLDQHVPAVEVDWTCVLYAFNIKRPTNVRETFQPTSFRELVARTALERIALYEREVIPFKRKRRVSDKLALADLQLALPWFSSWPRSFEERYRSALKKGRVEGDKRRTSYIQSRTLIAPTFPRLNKVVRRVAKGLLRIRVEDYLSNSTQSVDSAMKLLGLSRRHVVWMAMKGLFAGSTRVSTHAIDIPTESLLDLMVRISVMEDWASAAHRRGCSEQAMKQLLRIGLFDAVPLGDLGEGFVDPVTWDTFANFAFTMARRVPCDVHRLVALDTAIAASSHPVPDPERTARIVHSIATGALRVYSRRRAPTRLDELLLSTSELTRVAPRQWVTPRS